MKDLNLRNEIINYIEENINTNLMNLVYRKHLMNFTLKSKGGKGINKATGPN